MTGKEELLHGVIGGLSQNKGKGHLFFPDFRNTFGKFQVSYVLFR